MKGIQVFSIAVVALMVVGVFGTAVMASAPAALAVQKEVNAVPEEFSPEMRKLTLDAYLTADLKAKANTGLSAANALGQSFAVGEKAYFLYADYFYYEWTADVFTLKAVGPHCEIWVQDNRNFTVDTVPTRNDRVSITQEQVDYMLNEFENNIYPTEKEYFGVPLPRNGSESTVQEYFSLDNITTDVNGRVMIMILNIIDERYYLPTYPVYTAGYYSPQIDNFYDRNIIHVDCWDWANRTKAQDESTPGHYSYLYEGVFAHEYQHLLHDGLDPAEDSFINEGCADYAEMLCGYGVPWGHINYYLANPSNSLILWGDQGDENILADYGAAALFMIYLSDHFGGGKFVSKLAANTETGIAGVNAALVESGYSAWNFEKVFKYWKLANLIHSNYPGAGWYNYKSLNLLDSPVTISQDSVISYYPWQGVESSTLNAYGVDYVKINMRGPSVPSISTLRAKLTFEGMPTVSDDRWSILPDNDVPGLAEGNFYYSGTGDMIDYALRGEVDLTGLTEATLAFNTNWNMEDLWDFGFVQVSNDGGLTWSSLANANTTMVSDPDALPAIVDNLPGLTDVNHGQISFNLTEYAGQVIQVQFRIMTDTSVHYAGWYINNITLNGVLIDNANNVTTFAPVFAEVDYRVTLYAPMTYYRGMVLPTRIVDMSLNDLTERASLGLSTYAKYPYFYLIVSPTDGPVDYSFGVSTSYLLR